MKAIAAHRHHRFAPAALLLLALLVTGAVYAAVVPGPASAAVATTTDIDAGRKLFTANCATCHGPSAEGRDGAPSLVGVGAASVDFQVSTGRMPMVLNGPQAPATEPVFDAEQIAQLAAYVASLGAGPAVPSAEQVDPALGDAANGMALFRTNCAMCHGAVGAGGSLSEGKYAPSLGNSTPTQIYTAMLTGPQSMPVFNDANISPDEKRDIIAFLDAQKAGSPGGSDLGSVGPIAEGLWVWVIGIGVLIGAAVWIGAKSS
ncbi:c-type cytochrome [Actinotalea sp.]|uniref:cytochrome bc1 complex diheme cytochrome c subunit n=1 Tax=Actinotalea sp. TaxID=1872145 RepID=UPI002BF12599|nr:c-type cytochrome [Actinotalea sp.]HQY34336.1 c-type cytochrome [Actinotalea sp.]HRA51613.1 c-type cytochrome [Actinotalea sp.]